MKPLNILIGAALNLVPLVALACNVWTPTTGRPKTIRMLLHQRGGTSEIDVSLTGSKMLRRACEEALTSSGGVFKLAVLPETIKEIKTKETSLEILYPTPEEFQIAKAEKVIRLDRMLIPLSGRYAEAPSEKRFVTVFYGVGDYRSGPFTNTDEFHNRIKNLLRNMGYTLK